MQKVMKKTMLILALAAAMLMSATGFSGESSTVVKMKNDLTAAKRALSKTEGKFDDLKKDFAAMTRRCEIAEEKVAKLTRELAATQVELRAAKAAANKDDKKDELSALEPAKKDSK